MKNTRHKISAAAVAVAVAVVFAAHACKAEVGDSLYEIVPLREKTQPAAGETSVYDVPEGLTGHIFLDVEGKDWKPLSYDDAVAGVLSDTVSDPHRTLQADATFGQEDDGRLSAGSMQGGRRHYLVAVDGEDTIYAWRELKTAGDAGTVRLSIYFRPWKERTTPVATYTETDWTMVNRYVAPEPEEESGEPEEESGTSADD